MTHPNDTLNGVLLAFEVDCEKHLRGKFGYWRMVEERMVRRQIVAEGGNPTDTLEVSRRIVLNHKDDLLFRERQEAARATLPNNLANEPISFTHEELLELEDRYNGSNTEVGQRIWDKVFANLIRLGIKEMIK